MVSSSESSRDETTSHEDFYTLTKDSLPQIDVVNGVETMIVDGGCTRQKEPLIWVRTWIIYGLRTTVVLN
ncbi:hypothetical protein CsSME_00011038 [Camellia sinensis var. sinensis]